MRANLVVAAGTGLSRLTGFGRVAALAYALGQTSLTDTYNLANTMPNVVYELLLGGILTTTLVPVFVSHLDHDDEEATDAVVSVAVVVLLALTVVAVLAAPLIVHLYTLRVPPRTRRPCAARPQRSLGSSSPRSCSTASRHSESRSSTRGAASPRPRSLRCSTT